MSNRPPRLSRAAQFQSHQVLLGEHVPQAEFDRESTGVAGYHATRHQRLRIDDAPILEARPHAHSARITDEGGRIDGAEQAGSLQVAGDHLCDLLANFGIRLIRAGEIDQRDGKRLHMAARDVYAELGLGGRGGAEDRQAESEGGGEGQGAAQRAPNVSTQCQQSSHRRTVGSYVSILFNPGERLTPVD